MQNTRKIILYGFFVWAVPFVMGMLAFGLKTAGSPLFETVMAVTVTAAGVFFGLKYFRAVPECSLREGLYMGLAWFAISVILDLFLFMWGPMKMTFPAYMADIGFTYLIYPIVTTGLGILGEHKGAA